LSASFRRTVTPTLSQSRAAAAVIGYAVTVLIDEAITALLPQLASLTWGGLTRLFIFADAVIDSITVCIDKFRTGILLIGFTLFQTLRAFIFQFLLSQERGTADCEYYEKENWFHRYAPWKRAGGIGRPPLPLLCLLPAFARCAGWRCAVSARTITQTSTLTSTDTLPSTVASTVAGALSGMLTLL
jgi:hypothetical protein